MKYYEAGSQLKSQISGEGMKMKGVKKGNIQIQEYNVPTYIPYIQCSRVEKG